MGVKNIWNDGDNFCIELSGSSWGVQFAFPIKELAAGASLSRMMNLKIRNTLATSGWAFVVPASELKEVGREGVAALREVVEPYFASRGVGA